MSTAVRTLKTWFDGLSDDSKEEVYEFLYGHLPERAKGGRTGSVKEAKAYKMFLGPAPDGMISCPKCGRPF